MGVDRHREASRRGWLWAALSAGAVYAMWRRGRRWRRGQAENREFAEDLVDRESEDSFPASDAPSWTTGRMR